MDVEEMKEKIKALEDGETYFGIISQLSVERNIHLKTAWAIVEEQRKELNLRPRYKTYNSFANARSNRHKSGDLIFISGDE